MSKEDELMQTTQMMGLQKEIIQLYSKLSSNQQSSIEVRIKGHFVNILRHMINLKKNSTRLYMQLIPKPVVQHKYGIRKQFSNMVFTNFLFSRVAVKVCKSVYFFLN